VYVSTPGARHVSRQRPVSIQLLDHYDQIPADLVSPPPTARRHASFDNLLRLKPQPPIPDTAQGRSQGRGSPEVTADRGIVDSMTRKPSYDENDVILIDSAIYG